MIKAIQKQSQLYWQQCVSSHQMAKKIEKKEEREQEEEEEDEKGK